MSTSAKLILISITIVITSCKKQMQEPEKVLPGSWIISDVIISKDNSTEKDALVSEAVKMTLLKLGASMYFFPDGIAGEIFSKDFNAASWKYLPESNSLIFSSRRIDIY